MPDFTYSCFGLSIRADFELPELLPACQPPDVVVRLGPVPEHLECATGAGVPFESALGQFLLNIRNVARYLVLGGAEIVVDPAPGADPDSIRHFLLGTVLGELLHQRGLLPLHASAIATSQGAVAFAGPSAIGKSALAAVKVIADDLCALTVLPDPDAKPVVHAAIPQLVLWPDALGHLGIEESELRTVRPRVKRYIVPLGEAFATGDVILNTIFFLAVGDKTALEEITAEGKMVLAANTYRRLFSTNMKLCAEDSRRIKSVVRHTRMVRAIRPRHGWSVHGLADLIQQDFDR